MDYKKLDYLLGGEMETESKEIETLSESISFVISSLQSLNESDTELIQNELASIEAIFESIVLKLSLDESAIAGAFIIPLLSSIGIGAISIAMNRYMNGDTLIPMPILNVLNKLSNWVERGDSANRKEQVKKAILKSSKVSPKDADKIVSSLDKKKIEEMRAKFPRLAK